MDRTILLILSLFFTVINISFLIILLFYIVKDRTTKKKHRQEKLDKQRRKSIDYMKYGR